MARAPRRRTRATRRRRRRKGGVAVQMAVDNNKLLARAEDVTYGRDYGAARGHHHSNGRGRDDGRSDGLQQSTKTDEQEFGRHRALSSESSSRGRRTRRFTSTSRTRRRSTRSSSSNSCTGHRSSNHRGEFDQRNFLERHRKIDSIETLLLVNVRLIKQMSEEGRDVVGIIDHMELLIEKSLTKIYLLNSLVTYDASVKNRASENGLKEIGEVCNSEVLRHLSYDGTVIAQKMASQGKQSNKKSVSTSSSQNSCFAFNRPEGCKFNPCRYRHVCSGCNTQGHSVVNCKKSEPKA